MQGDRQIAGARTAGSVCRAGKSSRQGKKWVTVIDQAVVRSGKRSGKMAHYCGVKIAKNRDRPARESGLFSHARQ